MTYNIRCAPKACMTSKKPIPDGVQGPASGPLVGFRGKALVGSPGGKSPGSFWVLMPQRSQEDCYEYEG